MPVRCAQELTKRGHVLPLLKATLGQIDGSIKPKFSHFSKHASKAENLEAFGIQFYQVRRGAARRMAGAAFLVA